MVNLVKDCLASCTKQKAHVACAVLYASIMLFIVHLFLTKLQDLNHLTVSESTVVWFSKLSRYWAHLLCFDKKNSWQTST